jgi:hypothetical protein
MKVPAIVSFFFSCTTSYSDGRKQIAYNEKGLAMCGTSVFRHAWRLMLIFVLLLKL